MTVKIVLKGGRGRMGGPSAAGPDGQCVCPNCGERVDHETGKPCSDTRCPKCHITMARDEKDE